ncbi:helix-turn-helix transcriptional regulator [Streptomyces sp. NPDC002835]
MTRVSLPKPAPAVARRPLATPHEIAEYCGVPIATVYAWSSRGNGPKLIKVGRHLRARWDDIEKWLDAQTIAA